MTDVADVDLNSGVIGVFEGKALACSAFPANEAPSSTELV